MDCDYEDDGGLNGVLDVNNTSNSDSLVLKPSANILEANNNEECKITKESDEHGIMNGVVEEKQTQKNLPGEISLCTITNQINEDLAVENDNYECKSSPKTILQSPMASELSSTKEESLSENGSHTNKLDKCAIICDSEDLNVDQTVVSNNENANEKIADFIGKLAENTSEVKQNSYSVVDIEKSSESASDICVPAADSNLQSKSDTLKEIITVKSNVVETCANDKSNIFEAYLNTKSNGQISVTELIPPNSETSEVLDESLSEEEIYVEVEGDEQESDLGVEKSEESLKENDLKSHSICDNVSGSLKTNDVLNENNIPMNNDLPTGKNSDDITSESEVFEEVDGLSEKENSDLEISVEKEDESFSKKSSKILCSLDNESPQLESSGSENNEVRSEMKKNLSENDNVVSKVTDRKSLESNVAVEKNCSQNASVLSDISEMESLESTVTVDKNSSQNVSVTSEISDVKSLESNVEVEENSQNISDMETKDNTKINALDNFVVLSDVEWSDAEASDKQKTKEDEQNMKNEDIQNEEKCAVEGESHENLMNENRSASSDGDDFNLDDVIEEFAKEENKIVKLSDDELDDLVEEFVEAECSTPSVEKNIKSESKDLSSESDDEMELLIEDFKAVDSDNDCFIVQDSNSVVIIKDDDKTVPPKKKKSKLNESKSLTHINSNELSDNKVKNDVVSSTQNLSKKPEESSKVSENENIMMKEKEVEIINNKTDIENKKSFKIGFFKSEIFDHDVEENKQNNGSKPLELGKNNIEDTIKKGGINIVSALPLPERFRGQKVTLECRNDGIYLKKEDSSIDSPCSDGNAEKGNMAVNTDESNEVSNDYDKLSVDQSEITSATSKSLEEEQCMDDILKKVCTSSGNNAINNGDCKNSAVEKECKVENNFMPLEEKQIISQNGDVKSLDSVCHNTLEESKKRKLEILDNKSDDPQKKIKTEIGEAESDVVNAQSSTSRIDASVRKKVLEHFNEAFVTKVQLKKSWLEKLSKRLCRETLLGEYKKEMSHQKDIIKDLEDKLRAVEEDLQFSQSQASAFIAMQQVLFQKHHFIPQTAVRTVAVNVKIFRECDVPQHAPQPMPLPAVTKIEKPTTPTEIRGSTPVATVSPTKVQVGQQKNPAPLIKQATVSQTVTTAALPTPIQTRAATTTPQRFAPVAPNVTITKKEVPQGVNNSQPVQPRPVPVQKSQPPTKTCNQVIDLTDEESASKKLLSASSTLVSLASTSKVNLPGLQNNQNVLLPLNGLFQMLPAPTQNNSQFSLGNPVQVQQVTRQALVPPLPPNLLGPRTVAYIIPSSSGQISTIGRNSLPVSNFVPGSNQRLQTLIVRVTNPGQVTPMSTVINSNARMPVLTQGLRTPCTRHPSIPSSSSSSDLVLFPRQPKHPAPFPALPEYRPNPQLKALPPKPSLKGSKAPNGIILSWNMSLINLHAEIANYQLFAYQEAPGPVHSSLWKKVGDVKALPLPMACTLTQFIDGNRYYFTVRAVDVHNRFGPYSDAVSILFSDIKDSKSLK